jgi:hypothetical protein
MRFRSFLTVSAVSFTLALSLADDPKPGKADDKWADGDFTIGPTYKDAPELTVKDGVPRGVVTQFVMNSESGTERM